MKIALLFPGYGSQFVGMGKELYDEYRIVQEYFEEASNCLNINFVKLCFASSDAELGKINNAYPALFLVNSAIYALLSQEGVIPSVVTGYNNGEYAALFAGGCFSFPDGLYLLSKLTSFYQEALEGLDVKVIRIIGVHTQRLEDVCLKVSAYDGRAFIAIYNTSTDHIVAGHTNEIEQIRDILGIEADVSINHIGEEVGLHSVLMDSVVENYTMYLEKVDFKNLQIPMLSSLDGELISQGAEIKKRVIRHVNSPLVFTRVIEKLGEYDVIIEAHSGNGLGDMIKKRWPNKQILFMQKCADIENVKNMISTT